MDEDSSRQPAGAHVTVNAGPALSILMVFAAVYDSELPVTTAWNSALHDACGRAGEGGHESAHGFAGRQFTRRRHPYKAHPSPSGNQVVSNVTENTTLPDDSVRVGAVATPTCRVQPRGGDETTRTPLGGGQNVAGRTCVAPPVPAVTKNVADVEPAGAETWKRLAVPEATSVGCGAVKHTQTVMTGKLGGFPDTEASPGHMHIHAESQTRGQRQARTR